MISALFNPGLRERHWTKMSEIAGQDLTPTDVSVVRVRVNNDCIV